MALTVLGALGGTFQLISSPKWTPGKLLELDALELVYQGSYNKLAEFRNTLYKWKRSAIDSNMFLESFDDDGDQVKPKVTLRYIGCQGGVLPAIKKTHGNSLASADGGGDSSLTALYRSPKTTVSWIGRSDANNHAAFSNPEDDITLVRFTISGFSDYANTAAARTYFLSLFHTEEQLTDFSAEEIVPGQYWMCSATTAKVLIR